jgi:hypothetical protein
MGLMGGMGGMGIMRPPGAMLYFRSRDTETQRRDFGCWILDLNFLHDSIEN